MVMGFVSIIAMIAVFGIILADYSQQISQKAVAENRQKNPCGRNNQNKRSNRNNLVLVVSRSCQ